MDYRYHSIRYPFSPWLITDGGLIDLIRGNTLQFFRPYRYYFANGERRKTGEIRCHRKCSGMELLQCESFTPSLTTVNLPLEDGLLKSIRGGVRRLRTAHVEWKTSMYFTGDLTEIKNSSAVLRAVFMIFESSWSRLIGPKWVYLEFVKK